MRVRGVLLLTLLFASLMTSVERSAAGLNQWTTNGPFGGSTFALATHPTDPSVILVGTSGGIFRSSDAGSTWTRSSAGLPINAGVSDLEFAQSNPAIVFAGSRGDGFFKSEDGGRNWSRVGLPSDDDFVLTIAVHPTDPQILYAGTAANTYKSVNGGATWTKLLLGTGLSISGSELVIAPSDPNTIYSAGPDWWRSTDGGRTWDGPVAEPPHMHAAAVDPANPNVVFAGGGEGIHRSTDGGFTWSLTYELPVLDHLRALAIDPTDPSRMYAGAYFSSTYRSLDGGRSWSPYSDGLPPNEWVMDVDVLADGSAAVAGIRYFGFFRRTAEASAWSAHHEGLIGSNIRALATPPSGGPTVYAGATLQGVFRSRDNGASWQAVGLAGREINSLAVHPSRDATVYAATSDGLYKSTNAGSSWRLLHRIPYEDHMAVAIAPSKPSVAYAATFDGGVFRSGDGGTTWRKLSLDQYSVVLSLAVHPERPGTVYAGTRFLSVVRSTDGGKTWRVRDSFCSGCDPLQIAIDSTRPRIAYAAHDGGGLIRTTDSGKTWQSLARWKLPNSQAAVVIDRFQPNVVYISGYGEEPHDVTPGVYKSTDRGQTWTLLNEGLTSTNVLSLALSRSGRRLHAGTTDWGLESGGGVFSRTFG